jgi:hypothetical protein
VHEQVAIALGVVGERRPLGVYRGVPVRAGLRQAQLLAEWLDRLLCRGRHRRDGEHVRPMRTAELQARMSVTFSPRSGSST